MASGMLFNLILNTINELQNGKQVRKLHLLTGHDCTLWSMMHILKMKETESPPTTNSALILEIYQNEEEKTFGIQVIFNEQRRQIAGKDETDLADFFSLVEKYRLTKDQHQSLCNNYQPITELF